MAIYSIYIHDVVRISGEGAHKLINDTLTGRFDEVEGDARWFALLSPQGKVLTEGLAAFAHDAWWFDIEAGLVADFVKRMKMYRMRAKAEIEHLPNYSVLWSGGGEVPAGAVVTYADRRAPGLGQRFILDWKDTSANSGVGDPLEPFARARISAGIPEFGSEFGVNEVFAHDIGLDILDGIDFAKGCYVGQEVVSRMKHRGTARRRPVIVSGIDAPSGTPVITGTREAGTIGQVVDGQAVAILRLDRITDPAAVTVDGKPVKVSLPAWATYQFGETTPDE